MPLMALRQARRARLQHVWRLDERRREPGQGVPRCDSSGDGTHVDDVHEIGLTEVMRYSTSWSSFIRRVSGTGSAPTVRSLLSGER